MLGGRDSDKLLLGITFLVGVGIGAALLLYFFMRDSNRPAPISDPTGDIITRGIAEIARPTQHPDLLTHRVANDEEWEITRSGGDDGPIKKLKIHRDVKS